MCLAILGAATSGESEKNDTFWFGSWPPEPHAGFAVQPPLAADGEGFIVDGGDSLEDAEFCSDSEAFSCFDSVIVAFAAPKQWDARTRTWDYRGIRVTRLKAALDLEILGLRCRDVSLLAVSSKKAPASEWLYSESTGTLAVRIAGKSASAWLGGPIGYGARRGASKRPEDRSREAMHTENQGIEFRYGSWIDRKDDLVVLPSKERTGAGSVRRGASTESATICPTNGTLICVQSKELTFAVPQERSAARTPWSLGAYRFDLLKDDFTMTVLGRTYRGLMLIRSRSDAAPERQFIYSPTEGLLAIGLFGEGLLGTASMQTFWSRSGRGFGSRHEETDP